MEIHDTCAILVQKNGKILFVINKYRKGLEVPAGHVKENETHFEAAKREAKEEAGEIEVEEKPFFVFVHSADGYYKQEKYVPKHKHKCHVFYGKVKGKIRAGSDVERVLWLNKDEAEKIGIEDWVRRILIYGVKINSADY